jgi:LCP family protein required for cell wall assembly
MIEDEVRAAFARHEHLAPLAGPLREKIDKVAVTRRRRRLAMRVAGAAVAVAVAAVTVPALARPQSAAPPVGATPPPTTAAKNYLVLGVDADRADLVLIAHVPADRKRLYLVAIPRDTAVRSGKLNATFAKGGATATAAAVRDLTGVTIDGTAAIRYPALRKVTDALGGIRVCLDQEIASMHTGKRYPKGCQKLDGAGAVDVVRQRYRIANGALGRDKLGQRVFAALAAGVSDADPVRLAALARAASDGVDLDLNGQSLVDAVAEQRDLARAKVVGVGLTIGTVTLDDDHVTLDTGVAKELFKAVREDRLEQFTAAYPELVTR